MFLEQQISILRWFLKIMWHWWLEKWCWKFTAVCETVNLPASASSHLFPHLQWQRCIPECSGSPHGWFPCWCNYFRRPQREALIVLTSSSLQICIFTSRTRKERENRFDGDWLMERERGRTAVRWWQRDCERSSLTRSKGELCPAGTALHISSWTASCCLWWRWTCTGCDLHHEKHIKISAKV